MCLHIGLVVGEGFAPQNKKHHDQKGKEESCGERKPSVCYL